MAKKSIKYTSGEVSPEIPTIKKLFSWKNIFILGLFILALFLWQGKKYFIAATVNGQPISKWELNDQLMKKFGSQTLDNLINERLILAAVRGKGVFISNSEIEARLKEVEEKIKGKATLDEALKAQGFSRQDFKRQLEIQISIEKLFSKESTVSAKEVEEYISNNKDSYKKATDPSQVREEVRSILARQKMSDLFENWFSEIKNKAKIVKYL